jgi:hypothetical protein
LITQTGFAMLDELEKFAAEAKEKGGAQVTQQPEAHIPSLLCTAQGMLSCLAR